MASYRSDLAGQIKRTLSMDRVARFYGFEPSRAGFIHCPFHPHDKTPSLKIYEELGRGFHCYACGKGGSVIDFVMELFQIDFRQACVRLNNDFFLRLTNDVPDKKTVAEWQKKRLEEDKKRQAEEAEEMALILEHRYWWLVKQQTDGSKAFCWLHAVAVERLLCLEYLLNDRSERRWRASKEKNYPRPNGNTA